MTVKLAFFSIWTFQRSQNTDSASFDGMSYLTDQRYKKLQSRQQRRKFKKRIDFTQQKSVQIHWSPKCRFYYVLHVMMRLAMELVFFYTSYLLQTYQTNVSWINYGSCFQYHLNRPHFPNKLYHTFFTYYVIHQEITVKYYDISFDFSRLKSRLIS